MALEWHAPYPNRIMKELMPAQRRALRARAHSLHPTVSVSQNGLTAPVLAEIERALKAHELIKIRIYGEQREAREALLRDICQAADAAPVQHIGHSLVVFRETPEQAAQPTPSPAKSPVRKPAMPAARARRRVGSGKD